MNILILSWRGIGHPQSGGAEVSTHEHAKAWVKAGHKVTIFSSYFKRGKREEIIDGVFYKRLGRQILDVQLRAFFWYLFSPHEKFDLVVDQFHGIPFFTPLYIRAKKMAFIHEVTKEVWKFNPLPKPFNLIPKLLGPIFEPLIFKIFYHSIPFMTVSLSTAKDLTAWGIPKKNITVVHNGVSLFKSKTRPERSRGIKTVIFLGILTKDKGIEDAIETFARIYDQDKSYQFWIVGRGNRAYIKNQISKTCPEQSRGIKNKIKFWGYVSEGKKFELLKKAHVLINPSIREGWGLVNIEAAAMGTPTVAYNVAGSKDSIVNGKTGVLVAFGKPQSLASATVSLLNDKKRYMTFQKNAISWSKKFSWEKAGRLSLRLIEQI